MLLPWFGIHQCRAASGIELLTVLQGLFLAVGFNLNRGGAVSIASWRVCSKKPQAFAQGSFLRSFFCGLQTFPARTSQNAAPTL